MRVCGLYDIKRAECNFVLTNHGSVGFGWFVFGLVSVGVVCLQLVKARVRRWLRSGTSGGTKQGPAAAFRKCALVSSCLSDIEAAGGGGGVAKPHPADLDATTVALLDTPSMRSRWESVGRRVGPDVPKGNGETQQRIAPVHFQ